MVQVLYHVYIIIIDKNNNNNNKDTIHNLCITQLHVIGLHEKSCFNCDHKFCFSQFIKHNHPSITKKNQTKKKHEIPIIMSNN